MPIRREVDMSWRRSRGWGRCRCRRMRSQCWSVVASRTEISGSTGCWRSCARSSDLGQWQIHVGILESHLPMIRSKDISVVINYDVPHDSEDYVHRIGRTARASAEGLAITFVSEDEQESFSHIEKFLNKAIYRVPLPEEVGEGPEYNPSKPRPKGGRHKSKGYSRKK